MGLQLWSTYSKAASSRVWCSDPNLKAKKDSLGILRKYSNQLGNFSRVILTRVPAKCAGQVPRLGTAENNIALFEVKRYKLHCGAAQVI
jgi:hypothetical protein